jgi:hypothetical protein
MNLLTVRWNTGCTPHRDAKKFCKFHTDRESGCLCASLYFTGDFFFKLVDAWFGLQKKGYHLQIHEQSFQVVSLESTTEKNIVFGKKFKMRKKEKKDNIRNFWSSYEEVFSICLKEKTCKSLKDMSSYIWRHSKTISALNNQLYLVKLNKGIRHFMD